MGDQDHRHLPLNPRFARYHQIVSAPELWSPEAVEGALRLLRAQGDDNDERADEKPVGDAPKRVG